MIPSRFDYHAPATIAEAIALLTKYPDDAKVLSGGQSLLPLLKLRLGQAGHLVDIGKIPGLEYIKEEGGMLRIGGRTRESALERSEIVQCAQGDAAPHREQQTIFHAVVLSAAPAPNNRDAVLLLLRDIALDPLDLAGSNGERAVAFLPLEPADPDLLVDPGRGGPLDVSQHVRQPAPYNVRDGSHKSEEALCVGTTAALCTHRRVRRPRR